MVQNQPSGAARNRKVIEFAFTRWALVATILGLGAAGAVTFTGGVFLGVGATLRMVENESLVVEEALPEPSTVDESLNGFLEIEEPSNEAMPALYSTIEASSLVLLASPSSEFTVQVGRYRDHEEASTLYNQLWDEGFRPKIYSGWDDDDLLWHSVRIGRYDDPRDAEEEAARLGSTLQVHVVVRPDGAL